MKKVTKEIEDWIKSYVTITGDAVVVNEKLRDVAPARYFLHLTLPNKFEKYGIALHSYWINYKIPKEKVKEYNNEEFPEEEYTRISWKEFHELKECNFELNQAIIESVNWKWKFKQMNNDLYPGGGILDKEHIISLAKIIQDLYGNQEIEAFYIFLSTSDIKEDKMFEGKISELVKLLDNKELKFTPSLIYPKKGNWAVNTDYDLEFTTIGGDIELINKLVENNPNEIYEIEY